MSEAHADCDGLLRRLEDADEEKARLAERHEALSAKVRELGESNARLEREVAEAGMARYSLLLVSLAKCHLV